MATKSMGYDHPAYTAVFSQQVLATTGAAITGASTASQKYVAFTDLVIKSITTTLYAASATSSDVPLLLYRITNNGTTAVNTVTATYTFTGALGSGGYTANGVLNTASAVSTSAATSRTLTVGSYPTVTQGDLWYVAKGTDATDTVGFSVEFGVLPLANVTA